MSDAGYPLTSKHTRPQSHRQYDQRTMRIVPISSSSHPSQGHDEHTRHEGSDEEMEALLSETKIRLEELHKEWLMQHTKYCLLYNLRKGAIDLLKARQDAEIADQRLRQAQRAQEAEALRRNEAKGGRRASTTSSKRDQARIKEGKQAQKAKERASDETRSAVSQINGAKEEIIRNGADTSEDLTRIVEFAEDTAFALYQSTIRDTIKVLSTLDDVVELFDDLRKTYAQKDISNLKRLCEQLEEDLRKQREVSANLDGHWSLTKKLHQSTKDIRGDEVKQLARHRIMAEIRRQMQNMKQVRRE